jgi:hypothetical protein
VAARTIESYLSAPNGRLQPTSRQIEASPPPPLGRLPESVKTNVPLVTVLTLTAAEQFVIRIIAMLHSSRDLNQQRRRRVLLERSQVDASLVDAQPDPAELPVARGQRKNSAPQEPATTQPSLYFSKAVRSAYSLRVMQLLPLAPLSLALSICLASSLLAGLLATHYIVHHTPSTDPDTASLARLLHIRSPQGIAQWLSIQLWLLLAALTLLIYQLRRYTLDDYQARYRQWPLFALGCSLMSLERSSGALSLIGEGLDAWCSSQLGLPGWVCVRLAAAGCAALICLRLCSDLIEFPSSLTPWLLGWLAWGISGLLASGLLRLEIDAVYRDMLIGGGYLLGLLCVTLAATLYLRRNYQLAAQQLAKRTAASSRHPTAPAAADDPSSAPTARSRSGRQPATIEATAAAPSGATARWGWLRRSGTDRNLATQDNTPKRPPANRNSDFDSPSSSHPPSGRVDNSRVDNSRADNSRVAAASDRQQAWNGWFQKSPPAPKSSPPSAPTAKPASPTRSAGEPHESSDPRDPSAPRRPRGSLAKTAKSLVRLALPLPAIPRLLSGRIPKLSLPKVAAPKIKLPKLKLPQMRLLPPDQGPPTAPAKTAPQAPLSPSGSGRSASPVSHSAGPNDRLENLRSRGSSFQSAPAPTGSNANSPPPTATQPPSPDADRPLSRAERKALRRAARQNRDAA